MRQLPRRGAASMLQARRRAGFVPAPFARGTSRAHPDRMKTTLAVLTAALCLEAGCHRPPPDRESTDAARLGGPVTGVETLRDAYGVPHVYAVNAEAAAFAWGYAQAQDMRENLLMAAYAGEARAAETFGHSCLEKDC